MNSFFLTCLSWLRKLNSAAFFWSLANLFSYLDTFFSVGFMLNHVHRPYYCKVRVYIYLCIYSNWMERKRRIYCLKRGVTYNLPRRSFTWLFKSAICSDRTICALDSRFRVENETRKIMLISRLIAGKEWRKIEWERHPLTILSSNL